MVKFGTSDLVQLVSTFGYAFFTLSAFNVKEELKRLIKQNESIRNPIRVHVKNVNMIFYLFTTLMIIYRIQLLF